MTIDLAVVSALDERGTADFALGLWNDRWRMCDEEARCSYCLASQLPSNADTPLIHCEGCELSHEHYPLRDLRSILRGRSGPVDLSSVLSTNGVSLPALVRTRLANHLAALVCCEDRHALALRQKCVESFLEGVEAASDLDSETFNALSIAITLLAWKRRQELK